MTVSRTGSKTLGRKFIWTLFRCLFWFSVWMVLGTSWPRETDHLYSYTEDAKRPCRSSSKAGMGHAAWWEQRLGVHLRHVDEGAALCRTSIGSWQIVWSNDTFPTSGLPICSSMGGDFIYPEILVVSSVQFSCSVVSDSLRPHGLQHARLPCPSPIPGACSNSCLLSRFNLTVTPTVITYMEGSYLTSSLFIF